MVPKGNRFGDVLALDLVTTVEVGNRAGNAEDTEVPPSAQVHPLVRVIESRTCC